MAKVRTPRGAWVHAALQALAAGGPDAVRVETLAVSLGVSKGGFYWHFADRQALLEEMLDTWERTGTEDIIARVASHPGDARAKLQKLFDITSSPEGLAVELAVRDWSRRDGDVAGRLRRADNRRMEFVRSLFGEFCADEDDVEVRSMMSYSMVIGSYFVAVEHGAPQGAAVYWSFAEERGWRDQRNHRDLAGRDRFVTAVWEDERP